MGISFLTYFLFVKGKINLMIWYVADKDYVNYLHTIDNKVENIEYGNKLKPYLV